ncbi:tigger transposable element-derived protein 1-like [Phyllopteryx taeniolatus]|uniref:tigger transposable element-derived protein 1-like n=1 Tax=Phyllopteryx taeniolatus TaxID=161469 RepID=UPI002AD3D23D|nr:tigger transposable element-derived protein 1-like [Phyllopteryx taeniolatus]
MPLYEKVKILNMLRDGKTFSAVARCYGLNESTIRSIKKEEANIRCTLAINGAHTSKRVVNTRNKYIVRMESALVLWITKCREKNIPLNTNAMMEKARELYQELAAVNAERDKEDDNNPQPGPSSSSEEPVEFLASKGWFDRFRKRYQLKSVSPHWESASADVEAARKYPETFKSLIKEKGYKPEQVFNMDETGLFWKKMPTRTSIMKEETQAPGFKGHNDRVVLIMCANAAGFLMKPALIYKSANPRSLKSKDKNLLPVFWMHNSKVTITKPLIGEWFHDSFIPQATLYLSEKGLDFNICLTMDNASGHPLDLSYEGVHIEILPGNIQPLDQGIIRTFKALYTRNAMQHLVDARDSVENISVGELWKKFDIATALQVIQKCLQEIKPETLNGCWKKLWPECVQECKGFSPPEEIQRLAMDKAVKLANLLGGEGFGNIMPNDLNDLLESHSDPMADDDLAEFTKPASVEAEQEADPSQEDDEDEGLSLERLSAMAKTAKDLQRMVDAWDPYMVRALQFKNAIDGAMQTYKTLLTTMKKQRQQLPVTPLPITPDKPTSACSEEPPEYKELLALLPPEAPGDEAPYEEL